MKLLLCWFLVSLLLTSPLILRVWLQERRSKAEDLATLAALLQYFERTKALAMQADNRADEKKG